MSAGESHSGFAGGMKADYPFPMILVTGATGFLGHNLVPRLLDEGYRVKALVRPSSDTAFLERLGVELAYADDICDREAVARACLGCRQVIHAAGLFRFWGDPTAFWRTNVEGSSTVLEGAVAAGVERFIHISTVVVIGKTPEGQIDEETRCLPQEPYQESKLETERRVLACHQEQGLPVIILRPGAFYGPWGRYAFNRLFFEEPLRGWRIRINRGRHITFAAYAPDVAQAIILSLKKGRAGQIYNINSQSLDHNAANNMVSDLSGISRWRLNIPSWAVILLARAWTALSRYTHKEPYYPINMVSYVFQDWRVDTSKAERELGFRPTPFVEGAQKTMAWYRQQRFLRKWADKR